MLFVIFNTLYTTTYLTTIKGKLETLITSSIVIKLKTLPIISAVFAVSFSGKVLILESFVTR